MTSDDSPDEASKAPGTSGGFLRNAERIVAFSAGSPVVALALCLVASGALGYLASLAISPPTEPTPTSRSGDPARVVVRHPDLSPGDRSRLIEASERRLKNLFNRSDVVRHRAAEEEPDVAVSRRIHNQLLRSSTYFLSEQQLAEALDPTWQDGAIAETLELYSRASDDSRQLIAGDPLGLLRLAMDHPDAPRELYDGESAWPPSDGGRTIWTVELTGGTWDNKGEVREHVVDTLREELETLGLETVSAPELVFPFADETRGPLTLDEEHRSPTQIAATLGALAVVLFVFTRSLPVLLAWLVATSVGLLGAADLFRISVAAVLQAEWSLLLTAFVAGQTALLYLRFQHHLFLSQSVDSGWKGAAAASRSILLLGIKFLLCGGLLSLLTSAMIFLQAGAAALFGSITVLLAVPACVGLLGKPTTERMLAGVLMTPSRFATRFSFAATLAVVVTTIVLVPGLFRGPDAEVVGEESDSELAPTAAGGEEPAIDPSSAPATSPSDPAVTLFPHRIVIERPTEAEALEVAREAAEELDFLVRSNQLAHADTWLARLPGAQQQLDIAKRVSERGTVQDEVRERLTTALLEAGLTRQEIAAGVEATTEALRAPRELDLSLLSSLSSATGPRLIDRAGGVRVELPFYATADGLPFEPLDSLAQRLGGIDVLGPIGAPIQPHRESSIEQLPHFAALVALVAFVLLLVVFRSARLWLLTTIQLVATAIWLVAAVRALGWPAELLSWGSAALLAPLAIVPIITLLEEWHLSRSSDELVPAAAATLVLSLCLAVPLLVAMSRPELAGQTASALRIGLLALALSTVATVIWLPARLGDPLGNRWLQDDTEG